MSEYVLTLIHRNGCVNQDNVRCCTNGKLVNDKTFKINTISKFKVTTHICRHRLSIVDMLLY